MPEDGLMAAVAEGLTFEEAAPSSEGSALRPLVDPGGQGPARPGRRPARRPGSRSLLNSNHSRAGLGPSTAQS